MERNLFTKSERLYLKKDIENLFAKGKSFLSFPLRIFYLQRTCNETDGGVSVLVSVPKKRIRQAVNRNRIKRLVRESYRLNKNRLSGQHLHIGFIYIDNEVKPYSDIEKSIRRAFEMIEKNNTLKT